MASLHDRPCSGWVLSKNKDHVPLQWQDEAAIYAKFPKSMNLSGTDLKMFRKFFWRIWPLKLKSLLESVLSLPDGYQVEQISTASHSVNTMYPFKTQVYETNDNLPGGSWPSSN
jgi:hypothetical protein